RRGNIPQGEVIYSARIRRNRRKRIGPGKQSESGVIHKKLAQPLNLIEHGASILRSRLLRRTGSA
ncbi:MAG: hypothetical protein AB1502_09670, partial [Thermodesulfobacteriota bacterium]